jgi:DNA-binding CsgD family transcriptional regulator
VDPGVTRLAVVDRATTPLYRIEWRNPPPCPAVYRPDLLVERMDGTPGGWTFRLRAGDSEALQALQRECRDRGRNFAVRRLDRSATDADPATDRHGLTARQREVLMTAIDAGFFAIPRETALADPAADLDISDQTVSDHLRRAPSKISSGRPFSPIRRSFRGSRESSRSLRAPLRLDSGSPRANRRCPYVPGVQRRIRDSNVPPGGRRLPRSVDRENRSLEATECYRRTDALPGPVVFSRCPSRGL